MNLQNQLESMIKAEAESKAKQPKKRLTVTLSTKDYDGLEKQAEKLGITKTKYLNMLVASAIDSLS